MSTPTIHLGLCCINNTLRKNRIFNSRTCIRRTYTVEKAKEIEAKTRSQADCELWITERRKRLTASRIGSIAKMRKTTK